MGSLESGLQLKRDQVVPRALPVVPGASQVVPSRNERVLSFGQRPRPRFARFVLFKKIGFLQWICAVGVLFLFILGCFQMFLPGSVVEKSEKFGETNQDLGFLKEIQGLDFGEDVKFEPPKVLALFRKENRDVNMTIGSRKVLRFGYKKPLLAMVFADLLFDLQQVKMVTIALALREIGYEIEVYSLEDGPVHAVWKNIGIPLIILETSGKKSIIDWLNYDGILVNSIEARGVISRLLQEPFKSVPVIWTIHEQTLATRLREYLSSGQLDFLDDWKLVFSRASVVVFPNHALAMFYASCDAGNYFVIPGSPCEACKEVNSIVIHNHNLRVKMKFDRNDFVIAIASSQLLYKGLWLEHALVLQAVSPVLADFPVDNNSASRLRIIILSGDSTGNYSLAVEEMALNLGYPKATVKHAPIDVDTSSIVRMADLVIYGSFLEEHSFPEILVKSMCFGKPVIAPDLSMIRKYVEDRVSGYLFPKENLRILTQTLLEVVSKGKLSPLARNIASMGKHTARNLMVSASVEGYASLIENVLKLPSEVASPRPISEIPLSLKADWQWNIFNGISDSSFANRTLRSNDFVNKVEKEWYHSKNDSFGAPATDDTFLYSIWEEEKAIETMKARKRKEDDELKDRSDQSRGTWEDVYRNAKRAERLKNELHERDDGELERTGQPLCIYELYIGQGAWPFLHHAPLYRGLGLSSKGRRPKADDIDAPSRLPLLNNPYYHDVLGEFGGFFAIANRVDRIHKNAWIGFMSWRATARKESLSTMAESLLLDAIETHKHGDALYFWVRMENDPRNPLRQDFWSFCDAINAGNCKFAFSEALKNMYGLRNDLDSLPPMPMDGDTWSVMHSWALPTKSFLEFVMFSRMFVDALDAQIYDEHHESGHCYLSLSKDKHCYSRILELLINVWAYHSARRMVYIDPNTGLMQEQHNFTSRRGQMWVKWFSYNTLKSMDEDLAEEADSDGPKERWLWPLTGEVFYQGIYEKERNQQRREKEKRKQKSRDKIQRIKNRTHQKTIGKYIKPPPEAVLDSSNSTAVVR